MSKGNVRDFESKSRSTKRPETWFRLVLMTRSTDEDVQGFPRAMIAHFDHGIISQIEASAALFDKGGFHHLSIDVQGVLIPIYLDGDIRPNQQGWADPSNYSLQFFGRDALMYFTATVTDIDDFESDDALESDRFSLHDLQLLQGDQLPDGYLQLAVDTYAKLEDIETQIRREMNLLGD